MVGDDWFRRYSEAGAEILGGARARTEELIRELARAGESTQHQAQGAVVDLMGGGRRSADQLRDLVRREIANQLGALGIATTDDLKDLERRLRETPGNSGDVNSGDVGTGRVSDRSAEGTHGRPDNETRRPARRGKNEPADTAPRGDTPTNAAPTKTAPAKKAPAKKASAAERRPSGRSVKARSEGPSEKSRSSSGSTRGTANKASSARASKSNTSRTSRSEG